MKKLTNQEFDEKLSNLEGMEDYKRIGDYIDTKTKIDFLHTKCNKIFKAKPSNILQGYGCPHCNKKENKGQIKFEKQVFDLVGNEYTVIGKYKNYHSKVKMRHNKCGYEYDVKAGNFTSLGRRCPKCSGLIKKDENYVQERLDEIIPNEYTVVGEYKNNVTPIEIKHNYCGNKFCASLKNIQNGKFGCKHCKMSSGELLISNILKENNIEYEFQYKNKKCKDKNVLPFDFGIILNNKIFIIEYDGRQHFMPIFGRNDEEREKEFKNTIKHDQIKNQFCKDNNINLLRIKYDEEKEQIVNKIKSFLGIN